MRHIISFTCASILTLMLVSCVKKASQPNIEIENVWSRPVKVSAEKSNGASGSNGVVYLQIKNSGGMADRLLSASSNVCRVTEIHRTVVENNRMSMQRIEDGVAVPAGETVALEPGDYHIMLIGLQRSLHLGDRFAVELQFEKSGLKVVESEVMSH